ncbi:unnamed protein product, partial [Effrenium voratum]
KSLATALRQRVRRSRKQARGCYVGMEFCSKLRLREAVAAMLLGVEQEVRGHAAKPVSPAATGAGRSEAENGDDEFSLSYVVPLCGRAWWPSSGARNKRAHALNGNTARRDQTRGTFPNQWNSCWLAATLQSLFAAGRVRQAVSSHVGCGAAACGMCLLRKTEAESRSAGAEVVLCQDWAKPLRAFGCPLGPQQDPAEFVAQLVGLLGPKWLQVAGVQRTEVKALVPQCSCYGANLVETSRITAAETCINLYLPDASSSAEQSLNDLLRDNTLSARASGQRCPLCLQDITQREQTTYGCEDVLVFNVVREHGRKPVRADKVTLPDRMWPDEANTEYELRAVVCRSGASADSGHYVAFVRGAGSSWICYDDGVADAKRQPQLEMQRACRLIVYERTCETVKTEQPDRAPLPSTLVPDARLLSAAVKAEDGLGEPAVGTEADATMYPAASSAASEHGSERARVEDSHVGGKASANECEVDMEELEHMPVGEGQDALERDARALLGTFESGRCCRSFLSNLPLFRHEARSLSAAADAWHAEFADLCEDTVNGATAMHVQPYLGDTAL